MQFIMHTGLLHTSHLSYASSLAIRAPRLLPARPAMSATVLVFHGAAPTDHFLTFTTLAAQNKIFLRILLWRRELMADLAGHRRLCRTLRGPPLQRLGLPLQRLAISCSLLLKHPARYLILSPAPLLGGRRGPALVAEWARGAIVAARCVVEDADRSFTIMREWARSAVSAAALREENAALSVGHRRGASAERRMLSLCGVVLQSPCDVPESWEFSHGLLMEQLPPSERFNEWEGPRTSTVRPPLC